MVEFSSVSSAARLRCSSAVRSRHPASLLSWSAKLFCVALHLLLLAADLVEAVDILAHPLLVANERVDVGLDAPDFTIGRRHLALQVYDLFQLLARRVAQSLVADVRRQE